MDSNSFKITSLESSIFNEIQTIRQENGLTPLIIRQDLYTAALNHIRSIRKNNNTDLNGKIETREKLFWNAKQYTEINFVTKPCESDPIQTIISIIKAHFISQITSQVNSIGPAIIKLKSNRYVVSIFCAYFNPKISLREVNEKISDIAAINNPSNDFESLIGLINRLREMVPYQPFELKKVEPTNENEKPSKKYRKKVLSTKTSAELFYALLADTSFFNLITSQWTDFSYSTKLVSSNDHLKLNFFSNDEKYVYEIVLKADKTSNNANKDKLDAPLEDELDDILRQLEE